MNTLLLGIRGAIANGSEPTFDDQQMQPGIHLRWGFAPELGFPPSGFWLCRKVAGQGERRIKPPREIWVSGGNVSGHNASGQASSDSQGQSPTSSNQGNAGSPGISGYPTSSGSQGYPSTSPSSGSASSPLPWAPGVHEWHARLPERCHHVTVTGIAAEGVSEVILESYVHITTTQVVITGRHRVEIEQQRFDATIHSSAIIAVRVLGAAAIEDCDCSVVDPPRNLSDDDDDDDDRDLDPSPPPSPSDSGHYPGGASGGTGGTGGTGTGGTRVTGTGGVWSPPDRDGWQCLSRPFTLPVTVAPWPIRYVGAPSPTADPFDPNVAASDIKECERRLGLLLAGSNMQNNFGDLQNSLVKLVKDFPTTLLYDQPIDDPSNDKDNAPRLALNRMQQLLLFSLNPYMARVLDLYYVDTDAQPGVTYDYYLEGRWGATLCAVRITSPGKASATELAKGEAHIDGITILANTALSSMSRWTTDSASAIDLLQTIQFFGLTVDVKAQFYNVVSSIASLDQPSELLVLQTRWPIPTNVCNIKLARPVSQVAVQVAGSGSVTALHNGAVLETLPFNSQLLTTLTLNSPSLADSPIDELVFTSDGQPIFVGHIALRLLPQGSGIGTLYAQARVDTPMTMLDAPAQPAAVFRHRQVEFDPSGPALVPLSNIEVQWPAPPPSIVSGTPEDPPVDLPLPNQPVGYRAERRDTGASTVRMLRRIISPTSQAAPKGSPFFPAMLRIVRFSDVDVPDPQGQWTYRVAGFDGFGALGHWSTPTSPIDVERIAAEPTKVSVSNFDNSPKSGAHASASGDAWVGGRLTVQVAWSGAALVSYPDIASARVTVQDLDAPGRPILLTRDITVPPLQIIPTVASKIDTTFKPGFVYIQTTPPLPIVGPLDPAHLLFLVGQPNATGNLIIERYAVRPTIDPMYDPNHAVAVVPVSNSAVQKYSTRVVANAQAFLNQPAFLVLGYSVTLNFPSVPLTVPIDRTSARGRVFVTTSQVTPYAGQIPDPNTADAGDFSPTSRAVFTGQQWLTPAPPQEPVVPVPTHIVHHEYYDPADFYGRATRQLDPPFSTPVAQGVSGYVLLRAPAHSLFLSDLKRRQGLGAPGLTDLNPVVIDGGSPRGDLQLWIALLRNWLDAYNLRAYGISQPGRWLTPDTVLNNKDAQRAFIEHFYGGLLDDELRALASMDGNVTGFARVNSTPIPPGSTALADTIDGKGFGRVFYRLAAVNQAGSSSQKTIAAGPYYTQMVTPPRPPVLYKVQPRDTSIDVSWALDNNPNVAAYLVYRTDDLLQLNSDASQFADIRYFGPNPPQPGHTYPLLPTDLAQLQYTPAQWPPLSFNTSDDGPNSMDPRLIAIVQDPRLIARDYDGSDMAEVLLPAGIIPAQVFGVYRLSEYDGSKSPQNQLQAFNYWRPESGGTAQLVQDSATQARLTGLRVGLGLGVPVVVVARVGANIVPLGALLVPPATTALRRMAFSDGTPGGGATPDYARRFNRPALSPGKLYYYAVVAVDISGNRSAPSRVFAAQLLNVAQAAHV